MHVLRFEDDTHLLVGGEVDLVFADGSVRTMTFERLGNQIAFLRCGMYGGPNGGTPEGDLWHGMKVAQGDEVVVTGETHERAACRRYGRCSLVKISTIAGSPSTGEVTYGLVEPYETLRDEVAKAGVMGFSILD